jgi:transposase
MANEDTKAQNALPVAKAIEALYEIVERDVGLGLYDAQTLRFTVEARKEVVQKLSEQGLPNRKIAKLVGADEATVRRDLSAANAAPNAANAAPKSPKKQITEEQIKEHVDKAVAETSTAYEARLQRERESHAQEIQDLKVESENTKLQLPHQQAFSPPISIAISALVEATKNMTHEQKINVIVEVCKEIGVACSQVYKRDMELKEEAGLVTHVKLY